MSAPAGPCEWCGGPSWWTVIRGEVWTLCKQGCLPLPLEEEIQVRAAGSASEVDRVDFREASLYLTREGREAEAEAIAESSDFGSPD